MATSDQLRDASLDALAMIGAAARNDGKSVEAMLSTYDEKSESDKAERGMLLGGLLAHAVALTSALATARGCTTDEIVKGVHASLVSDPPK